MKKALPLFFILILYIGMNVQAQQPEHTPVYLSNYTLPAKGDVIGTIQTKTGSIKSVKFTGAYVNAFEVSKDYRLSVRRDRLPDAPVFTISMTVKTTTGAYNVNFRIVHDTFIQNHVIAHRGAWKNTQVPENSVAALNHAIRLGCMGSEFDVHMTADSLVVVNHDEKYQGLSIAQSKAADLLALRLPNGEEIPTLETYLKTGVVQTKTKLILEIKQSELGKESSLALTRRVVALVEKLQAQAWVEYISFDYDVCKEIMLLAPYARVAYLNGDKTPAELAAAKFFGFDYHFSVLQKNPSWIADAKQNHLTTNAWTVNDQAVMKALLEQQIDFITTNEPELLLSLVKP